MNAPHIASPDFTADLAALRQRRAAAIEQAHWMAFDYCVQKPSAFGAKWFEQALRMLKHYASIQAGRFTVEMLRGCIARELDESREPHAWGAVAVEARRLGLIVAAGTLPAFSSNGAQRCAYRRGPNA